MGQDVAYGTSSVDPVVRLHRIKSDHTMIQQPVADGDSEFSDIDDAEFASEIIGDIGVAAQDDGSTQFSFVCAAWGAELLDFINNYKNVNAAGEKSEFVGFQGKKWGGDGDSGTNDQLLLTAHLAPDPDTGKGIVLAAIVNLDPAAGSLTIQPNESTQVQLQFNQVKPKVDLTIHNAAGTKSLFNSALVDFTVESADRDMLQDNYKWHFPVALVS